ncbi:unnamed protein product [Closterium sp. NIES-65]|nr:unnamed protein product [Closterium sp. NIES-65]
MGTAMVVSEGGGKQAQVNAGIGAADLIGAVDSPHPLAVVLRLLDARGRAERGNAEAVGQGGERGAEEEEKVEKEKGKEKEKEKEKGKEREKSKAREKEDGQQPALLVLRFEMLWNLGIICDSGLLFPNMAKEPLARESGFVAALSARVSRPYYWAQLMCGLDFLPPLPPSFLLPPGSSAAAGAADGAATAAGAAAAASAAAAMEVEPSAATSSGAAAPPAAPSTAAAAGAAVAVAREGGAAETGPGGARAQLLERLEAFREERRLGRVLQAMRERVTAARELNWQLLIGPLGFPNATCSSQIGGKAEEGDLASGKGGEKRGKERRGEGRSEREGEKDRSDRKGDEKKGEEKKGDERKGDERKRDEKKGDERKGEKGSGEDGSSRGRGEGTGGGKGRDEAFGRLAVGGFGRESSLPVGGLGGECALPPGAMLAQALVIAQRRRLGGLAGAVGLGGVAGLAGVSGVEGGGTGGAGGGGGGRGGGDSGSGGSGERKGRKEEGERCVCDLQALVVIYPDFPRRPPLFSLHLLSPTTPSAHQQPLLPSSTAQVTLSPSASSLTSHASSLLDGLFSLESEVNMGSMGSATSPPSAYLTPTMAALTTSSLSSMVATSAFSACGASSRALASSAAISGTPVLRSAVSVSNRAPAGKANGSVRCSAKPSASNDESNRAFALRSFREKKAFKAIAGLNNFNADSVAAVVSAAEKICVSAVEPEKFVEAVAAGAHMIEIGNFDSFYPDGREFTAEKVLDLTRRTRQLLPSIALSVTVPHTLPLPEQVALAEALQECGADVIQTEGGTSSAASSAGVQGLVEKATPTIAATYSIARAVTIPVMCASGLSAVTVPLAFAAGASGVGVGSAINRLNEPIAMVAAVREIANAVNSQVTEKKAAASGANN